MLHKFNTPLNVLLILSFFLSLISIPASADALPSVTPCTANCHTNNAAFLNSDWFAYAQTPANIQTYVKELATKKIKYQFADIGVLNDTKTSTNGMLAAANYAGLAKWIKTSKQTDPNQLIIIDLNYAKRLARVNGVKVANPSFGNDTFNKNVNALINKLVNMGLQIGGTGPFYKADGVHLDFEGFMQNDTTLLNTLKYLRKNALAANNNFSMSTPADPSFDGTIKYQWSSSYISQVAAILNMINPMIYDQMGWGSDIYTASDYENLWTNEITRYSKAIGTTGPGGIRAQLVPTVPAYAIRISDDATVYHDPIVENIYAALNGLNAAISNNGANVSGAGIFWWSNFIGRNSSAYPVSFYSADQRNWMTEWVNYS